MKTFTRDELLPIALEHGFGHCEVGFRLVSLVNRVVNQVYLQALLELDGSRYLATYSSPGDPKSLPAPLAETWVQDVTELLREYRESAIRRA